MSTVKTPIGWLRIEEREGRLVEVDVLRRKPDRGHSASSLGRRIERQISGYFQSGLKKFDLPLRPRGTEFQRRVWRALQKIPFGQVKSYGELARELNSSPRAVGNACRANPIPIIIPCHRVVSATGIGGYAGKTTGPLVDRKRWLLRHEGADID